MSHLPARPFAAAMVALALMMPLTASAQVAEGVSADSGGPAPRVDPAPSAAPAAGWRVDPVASAAAPRADERPEAFDFLPRHRPTSVEWYVTERRALRAGLQAARERNAKAEVRAYRRDLETLEEWFDEDTALRSPGAMAGGIVMVSLGGAATVMGLGALVVGSSYDPVAAIGGALTGGGVLFLATGIPLIAWGSDQEMVDEVDLSSTGAGRLVVGPGGAHLEGSF